MRTGFPEVYNSGLGPERSAWDFDRKIGNGSDRQAKLDLAKCEGSLFYADDRNGQEHFIDRDGKETCPTHEDPFHRC